MTTNTVTHLDTPIGRLELNVPEGFDLPTALRRATLTAEGRQLADGIHDGGTTVWPDPAQLVDIWGSIVTAIDDDRLPGGRLELTDPLPDVARRMSFSTDTLVRQWGAGAVQWLAHLHTARILADTLTRLGGN